MADHQPAFDEFRRVMQEVEAPRFDRICVRDLAMFDSVPRIPPLPLGRETFSFLGIPVHQDDAVERGVIELRKGDEVVERVYV